MLGRLGHNPRALLAGNTLSLGMALVRNVLLARLIGPEQFGIAATLLLLILFFDAISDTGADRYLIQSVEGDRQETQRTVQSVVLIRGVVQALLMVAAAIPLTWLFNTPGAASGYMWLALVPLLMGFLHLDVKRAQRRSNFGPEIVMLVAAEVVSLMVTVGFALLLRDFHAALYGLIARAAIMCLVSHLAAERRYALGWDKQVLARVLGFGWPLLLSAMVLLVAMQSDRLMVSALIGPLELGIYSAATLLVFAPFQVLFTTFARVGLARLARYQDDLQQFDRHFLRFTAVVLVVAIVAGLCFVCFGRIVSGLLFGDAYAVPSLLFAILGFLQATRFLRVWPTCGSLALGATRDLLAANVARLLAVPLGYALFIGLGTLSALAAGFLIGEVIALGWAVIRYNRLRGAPLHRNFKTLAIFLASLGAALAALPLLTGPIAAAAVFFGLTIAAMLLLTLFKPSMAKSLLSFVRRPEEPIVPSAPAS